MIVPTTEIPVCDASPKYVQVSGTAEEVRKYIIRAADGGTYDWRNDFPSYWHEVLEREQNSTTVAFDIYMYDYLRPKDVSQETWDSFVRWYLTKPLR